MIHDDRQRLWYFTRGERIAVIVLLVAIAATLAVRAYVRRSEVVTLNDTVWIEKEVPAFERQLERPASTPAPKKAKTYTPRRQNLQPIERENDIPK